MAYLLVIDDDEDFGNAVSTVLESEGHEVSVELDPAGGLSSMEGRLPDLVILDVIFPENDTAGFDLARTIVSDRERFKGVPILMLTAVNKKFPLGFSEKDIDEEWLPVTDFLEKPVDLDVLKNRVAALLQKAGGA